MITREPQTISSLFLSIHYSIKYYRVIFGGKFYPIGIKRTPLNEFLCELCAQPLRPLRLKNY